jgi:F-type H+-transporting ATPase subunit gamma
MEQLILMKQRIKAVGTIKKVTHAMRLISMSSHTRLNANKKQLITFKKTFEAIWNSVRPVLPKAPEEQQVREEHHLLILIGSQKGLCGPFNTNLYKFFGHHRLTLRSQTSYIGVGSYAVDYLERKQISQVASFSTFTPQTFVAIAQAITEHIMNSPLTYSRVTVFSNKQKSFFVQLPQQVTVYPLVHLEAEEAIETDYLFEQSPAKLKETLEHMLLTLNLQELLFDSLISEQAARFVSMDSSTRNAENLLTTLKTGYNKIRQTNITRELTELSASQ